MKSARKYTSRVSIFILCLVVIGQYYVNSRLRDSFQALSSSIRLIEMDTNENAVQQKMLQLLVQQLVDQLPLANENPSRPISGIENAEPSDNSTEDFQRLGSEIIAISEQLTRSSRTAQNRLTALREAFETATTITSLKQGFADNSILMNPANALEELSGLNEENLNIFLDELAMIAASEVADGYVPSSDIFTAFQDQLRFLRNALDGISLDLPPDQLMVIRDYIDASENEFNLLFERLAEERQNINDATR